MATNGVYFGAEIVRDLTPAPGSRMAKRRGRRRERVGWGRAGRGSLHLRLPLSCFSHLHPSLSFSVHLSLCLLPPLAVKNPPPMFASSFLGRIPGLWSLAPRYPCLRVKTRIPGQTRKIPRGLGEDGGAGIGKVPEMSMSHSCPQPCSSSRHHLRLPLASAAWLWSQRSTWEKLSWSKAGPRSFLPAQGILAVWVF